MATNSGRVWSEEPESAARNVLRSLDLGYLGDMSLRVCSLGLAHCVDSLLPNLSLDCWLTMGGFGLYCFLFEAVIISSCRFKRQR